MSTNGKRRPPRPRIEVGTAMATPEEAAAISAALERFLADAAPPPARHQPSRWQRAALVEGVSARLTAVPTQPGSGFPPG